MEKYQIYTSNNFIPEVFTNKTQARQALGDIIQEERSLAPYKLYSHWSGDRADCTLTLGPDPHSSMWDRYGFVEVEID